MPTTPAQLQFVQEVPTSAVGDTVPNAPVGSLILFADADTWYAKNSAGVVTALSGVTNVTNSDGTITIAVAGTSRTVSRPAITGDISVPVASNVATLPNINGNVGSFGSASAVATQTVNAKGQTTAAATVPIVIAESAVTNLVSDLAGKQPTGNYITALTSDVTAAGPGSAAATLATVNGNVGAFGSASAVGTFTVDAKGRTTAAATVPIVIAESAVTNLVTDLAAKVPNTRNVNTTAPLAGGGPLSGDLTLTIAAASTSVAGSMSAIDKLKLDNLWIDVTANTIALVTPAQSAATNTTNIGTLLAGAANGATIYFPPGRYDFSGAWTMPNKMFTFVGRGQNRAGSPATAFTELRWTSNVGASLIVLPGSGNGWYTTFNNLTFTTTVDQTVGTVVDANGNVGVNFHQCAFQSNGGFFLDVITYGGGAGSNSANSTVVDNCNIQGFKGQGVRVNAAGSSLVISNSVIQGQWGTTAQAATACVSGGWVGALQIIACDILGGTNNLLVNPVAASSEVAASIHCTNTYFDSSFGSCIKGTGTGAWVRSKFDGCTFTTNTGGTAFSAVELAGSFAYTAGGQDIAFSNCNIYNTFGTTGTTNGVLITNAADVSFTNCRVAGWTNGYNITPMASNKTNVQVIGGACGPSGNQAANTTGFNIVGGAYKGLQIRGCNALGNTTNLTLGAVTVVSNAEAALFAITDNPGINPRGAVTTPTFPTSTTVVTNITGFRCLVRISGGTVTVYTVNGVSTGLGAAATLFFPLDPGGTVAMTYSVAATWTWIGQ